MTSIIFSDMIQRLMCFGARQDFLLKTSVVMPCLGSQKKADRKLMSDSSGRECDVIDSDYSGRPIRKLIVDSHG